jgi:hypothetical protein
MFPWGLVKSTHRGAFICREWELRVTERCVDEDLERPPDTDFEDLRNIEIIKEFVNGRSTRTDDRNEISPLSTGCKIWVLSRGHDHRGATFYDDEEKVVWLLAYGRHRSGSPSDFFPYCTELDRKGELLPTEADYRRMYDERDERLAKALPIETAIALKIARGNPGEHRFTLGGHLGVGLVAEVAEDLEELTVAFDVESIHWGWVQPILSLLRPAQDSTDGWSDSQRLPSRPLAPNEVGFVHFHDTPQSPDDSVSEVKAFHVKNVARMRRALEHHNIKCPLPADSFSLNPIDFDLLGYTNLWGVPVEPDDSVATRSFRLECEGSASAIEDALEEWTAEESPHKDVDQ